MQGHNLSMFFSAILFFLTEQENGERKGQETKKIKYKSKRERMKKARSRRIVWKLSRDRDTAQ